MVNPNRDHSDPIDKATEILQGEGEEIKEATEILRASRQGEVSRSVAAAVAADVRRRRHWWPVDPLLAAVIMLAIAVVTLSVIMAIQAKNTTERSSNNQQKLTTLTENVFKLSDHLSSLEENDLAKDQLNSDLLEQDRKLRAYLRAHHINPDAIAGPLPKLLPDATNAK